MEFNLVERATLAPSCCFLCRANKGKMIDTGIVGRMPWGRVYICVDSCLRDLARVGGALTGPQVAGSAQENRELRALVAELQAEVQRLRPFERSIVTAREQLTRAS